MPWVDESTSKKDFLPKTLKKVIDNSVSNKEIMTGYFVILNSTNFFCNQ